MAEHILGPIDEFPVGTHRIVAVGKAKVGVFNVDGHFYALPNICPHQFGPLCEGPVGGMMVCNAATGWRHELQRQGEILTCPWHGLEFDMATGRCLSSPRFRVRQYAIWVDNGIVKLEL